MGLTQVLSNLAAQRAHVLLVEAADGWRTRVTAEQAVAALGWRIGLAPADADVLAVCGTPGTELAAAVERIWEQLPGPRVRVALGSPAEALPRLEEARLRLMDVDAHVRDARTRARTPGERPDASASAAAGHGHAPSGDDAGMELRHGQRSPGAMSASPLNDSPTQHHAAADDLGTQHMHHPGGAMPETGPDRPEDHAGMEHSGMAHSDRAEDDAGHAGMDHNAMGHSAMDHGAMGHAGMDHNAMDHGAMGHAGMDHGSMGHAGMDHGSMGHAGMDHGSMGHDGMDHGSMDMAPGGIQLAGGADDRDGLEMDTLTVQLGPVLPYWPAGIVVRCSLNGDVLTRAEARWVDGAAPHVADSGGREAAARRCDDVAALLALAGASDLAAGARRLRDGFLADDAAPDGGAVDRLERRIRRSPLLRWSLGRLGVLDDPALASRLGEQPGGGVFDRLLAMVGAVRGVPSGSARQQPDAARLVAAVPQLVTGLDLAAARLVVASLGIPSATAAVGAAHG